MICDGTKLCNSVLRAQILGLYDLETEDEVKLSRFGNFVVRSKAPREGRNPKTGQEAVIAARRVVTFRPSPMLKSLVDQK